MSASRSAINATITLDFKLALAGVAEAVTVTGAAPLIEVTQSKVASSIEATEIENLPMITRTVSGMLSLLPGAATMAPIHRTKENVGSVSYGGASGTNVIPTVDGADNRDNHYGGPLMNFTTEALEQFQLAHEPVHRRGRALGRRGADDGHQVGHQRAARLGVLFARDRALTAKDYFTRQANAEKVPFSRQQFGGSLGGPIAAQSRVLLRRARTGRARTRAIPVPDRLFNEQELLVAATNAGLLPPGLVNPDHPRFGTDSGGAHACTPSRRTRSSPTRTR